MDKKNMCSKRHTCKAIKFNMGQCTYYEKCKNHNFDCGYCEYYVGVKKCRNKKAWPENQENETVR
jgi:hypothetical protein